VLGDAWILIMSLEAMKKLGKKPCNRRARELGLLDWIQ
jgi:hypothetical protein